MNDWNELYLVVREILSCLANVAKIGGFILAVWKEYKHRQTDVGEDESPAGTGLS